MGLYDNYQLANSSQVRRYQGSTVPELMQVSQELQKRYDAAAEGQDYVGRFINGMQALDQDRPLLKELSKQYSSRLRDLSGRKDLENTMRETTMLGRDLPAAYAPFAQRMKDAAEYQDQLEKAVRDGKINQTTAAGMLALSKKRDKGLTKDPMTGHYTGRFQGQMFVNDIDVDKKVDEWMEHVDPQVVGGKVDKVNGQWIVTNGSKREVLSSDRIRDVIRAGATNDSEYQAWVRQQQDLGTFRNDYSNIDPSALNLDQQLGSIAKPGGKKGETIPLTLRDVLQKYTDHGISTADALQMIGRNQISNDILSNAINYGVNKYAKNNITTDFGLKGNPYAVADYNHSLKDTVIPMTASILQPTPASKLTTPGALDNEISSFDKANRDNYAAFTQWLNNPDNKVTAVGKDGSPVSPYSPDARFYDSNGVEKTVEARKFIDAQQQSAHAAQQLADKRKKAMARADYHPSKDDLADAQKAYDRTYQETGVVGSPSGVGKIYSEEERRQNAQAAYNDVLRKANGPAFQKYQKIIEQDAKGDSVPVGISTFRSKSLNEAAEKMFSTLALNLDSDGLNSGTQGLEWAAGENAGQPLEADDYEKIIGKAEYAGGGIDADGQYKMFFKVGTSKVNAKGEAVGESVLVKMPAFAGMAETLVKEGQTTQAQQYLAQNMASLNNEMNQRTIDLPVAGNLKVKVTKVLPSEKTYVERNSGVNYVVSYPLSDGSVKEYAASSIDEATANIIGALQNNLKKAK